MNAATTSRLAALCDIEMGTVRLLAERLGVRPTVEQVEIRPGSERLERRLKTLWRSSEALDALEHLSLSKYSTLSQAEVRSARAGCEDEWVTSDTLCALLGKEVRESNVEVVAARLRRSNVEHKRVLLPVRFTAGSTSRRGLTFPARDFLFAYAADLVGRRPARPLLSTITTEELARKVASSQRHDLAVPVPSAVKLPEADLLVDPYLLGVWLGDGRSAAGAITVGREDVDDLQRTLSTHWRNISRERDHNGNFVLALGKPDPSLCLRGHDLNDRTQWRLPQMQLEGMPGQDLEPTVRPSPFFDRRPRRQAHPDGISTRHLLSNGSPCCRASWTPTGVSMKTGVAN